MDKKPQRRLILPEKRTQAELNLNAMEITPDSILDDALQTAAIEIARYRVKVGNNVALDSKESKIVQGWVETLVKLKREQREQDRADDLSKLSQEELVQLAKKVLNEGSTVLEQSAYDESED